MDFVSEFLMQATVLIVFVVLLLNLIFSLLIAFRAEIRKQSFGLVLTVGLVFGFATALLLLAIHDLIHRNWKLDDLGEKITIESLAGEKD
jgi:hypothetical protein